MSEDPADHDAAAFERATIARQLGLVIEAPAPASAGRAVALVASARFRDPLTRQRSFLVIGISVAFIALTLMAGAFAFAAGWAVLVVVGYVASATSAAFRWRATGGARSSIAIRGGGFDLVTPSSRTWVPAGHLVRWGLGGSALELLVRDRGTYVFDLAGLGVPKEAIDARFQAPSDAPSPTDGDVVARFAASPTDRRATRAALRELAPRSRMIGFGYAAIVLVELAVLLLAWAAIVRVARFGWDGARRSTFADVAVSVAAVVAVVGALVGVLYVLFRRQATAKPRVAYEIASDGSAIWFAQDDGIVIRFDLATITRAREQDGEVAFVTVAPYGVGRIPADGFVDGGRERLLAALVPVLV